ncbi:MAG: D-glycero-beta-D-manno-heptose 1-phosphate adenylyltransferase [Cryobacterium sp.]|nr:D-glycero-beta-D-manno-heptose 1-phosphate adenylyltransferase [Oligoflexia bacterium]
MTSRDPRTKVKSVSALKRILAKSKTSKRKIVFTNGVFDLLHKGHITYLHQARKLGAILVVALNEDDSVRRLKGPTRPLNLVADRMLTLAGLESVDYVTSFSEDTPLEIIRLLKPDVLVKGGDYRIDQIVGADDVLERGGKVKSLPFVDGYSTTKTLARAK